MLSLLNQALERKIETNFVDCDLKVGILRVQEVVQIGQYFFSASVKKTSKEFFSCIILEIRGQRNVTFFVNRT
mgnify:CR=1 FL=1